jgi:hypothetical protein
MLIQKPIGQKFNHMDNKTSSSNYNADFSAWERHVSTSILFLPNGGKTTNNSYWSDNLRIIRFFFYFKN